MVGEEFRFTVLGPVTGWRGSERLEIGTPQRQAVLAALLLHRNRTLSLGELINAVWGASAPPRASGAVRNYAADLRAMLEPDRTARTPARLLVSVGSGYALRIPDATVDWDSAQAQITEAQRAKESGDLNAARALLSDAAALWVGEPLSGVPGPFAAQQRAKLAEQHLAVLSARIDIDLALGRHDELVSELIGLTAEHPLAEGTHGQLMTALYRSGRQAEALRVFTDIRRRLIDELGVEPGSELAELHQQLLRGELTTPQRPSGVLAPTPVRNPQPAQLPSDLSDFTGRADTVDQLTTRLRNQDSPAVPVSVITGMGGIGKTTLALHVAHLIRDSFPDGQLYANLRGMDAHPADPDVVLGGFLRALGYADGELPASLDDRSALFRTAAAGKRLLMVLDNAADADQIRPLLPGGAGNAVLITSRSSLTGLPGAVTTSLDTYSPTESLDLLTRIVGEPRVRADPDAARLIIEACGQLPLAVRIIAARLAARPQWSLASVVRRVADERHRIGELETGDIAVEATFHLGYRQLNTEQARAFRLAAAVESPDLPAPAIACLLRHSDAQAERLCEELVDLNLLLSPAPGRYRYHDLVRLFARSLPGSDHPAALATLLDFYLASAKNLVTLWNPRTRLPEYVTATTARGQMFDDESDAHKWLATERGTLAALYRQVAAADTVELLPVAADLCWTLAETLFISDGNLDLVQPLHDLLDRAIRIGDSGSEARIRIGLHTSQVMERGRYDEESRTSMERASALASRTGNARLYATAEMSLAGVVMIAQPTAAVPHWTAAAEIFQRLDDDWGMGMSYGFAGWTCAEAAMLDDAQSASEQALTSARTTGHRFIEAFALHTLSRIAWRRQMFPEAVRFGADAVALAHRTRHRVLQGWTLIRLSEAQLAVGDTLAAVDTATESVRALIDSADPVRRIGALMAQSQALAAAGRDAEARTAMHNANELIAQLKPAESAGNAETLPDVKLPSDSRTPGPC